MDFHMYGKPNHVIGFDLFLLNDIDQQRPVILNRSVNKIFNDERSILNAQRDRR